MTGNLLADLPASLAGEELRALLTTPDLRIERIVSTGQASPPGFWYDQDWAEWVLVLAGQAGLLIEGETAPRPCWSPAATCISRRIAGTAWNGPQRRCPRCGWRCIIAEATLNQPTWTSPPGSAHLGQNAHCRPMPFAASTVTWCAAPVAETCDCSTNCRCLLPGSEKTA